MYSLSLGPGPQGLGFDKGPFNLGPGLDNPWQAHLNLGLGLGNPLTGLHGNIETISNHSP